MVRDFCFWAVWAAGPLHKKKLGADYEQPLRAFFSCLRGQKKFEFIFENIIAFALKSCIINNFFCIKLGLRTFSNVNVLHKGFLLQDWVFRLRYLDFTEKKAGQQLCLIVC